MQHFFSEKKIDKTTLPGRKAEYDIHFIRDHKQLQVPFFPKKDRPNDIKLSPPVSKTIVSYSIRGEISSDFFAFFTKKA